MFNKKTINFKIKLFLDNKFRFSSLNFERVLCRIGKYAAENNASIHMPQIWYKLGIKESEIKFLIQKYLCQRFGLNVYIYYYKSNH